ncbi:MAG: glycosyl hydrolase 108 family protein [Verrucomicrobiae bacterium]
MSDFSPRFLAFIGFVKQAETVWKKGHYGDDAFVVVERDPNDSGGTTKWGLDAATHGEGVAKLSWPEAEQIYWDYYWNGNGQYGSCEILIDKVGEIIFDTRINMGMKPANKILGQGDNDPAKILEARDARYRAIVKANPRKAEYLQGWLNRDQNLRKRLGI